MLQPYYPMSSRYFHQALVTAQLLSSSRFDQNSDIHRLATSIQLRSSIEKMRGVALLSMVALGAFLCIVLCVLRFGLQRIEAGHVEQLLSWGEAVE